MNTFIIFLMDPRSNLSHFSHLSRMERVVKDMASMFPNIP